MLVLPKEKYRFPDVIAFNQSWKDIKGKSSKFKFLIADVMVLFFVK